MFHKEDKIEWLDGGFQRLDPQLRLGWWERATEEEEASVQSYMVRNRQLPKYLRRRTNKYKGL